MISMDKIDSIRKKYRQGESVASIARSLGVSRDTVYKYATMQDLSPKMPIQTQKRSSKMDKWKKMVDSWLEDDLHENKKQRHTAHRIWERLTQEYGADISEASVRRYVHSAKLRLKVDTQQFLDLEWSAGSAQVDFGHAVFSFRGVRQTYPYFVMSFPYSNVGLAQIMPGENSECVCQGLKNCFEFIGGVPQTIVFDNATGVGRRNHSKIKLAELFQRCSAHYGFEYRFCNPYAGHEKGSVENKVGTLRRSLFVPTPRIWNMDTYNAHLLDTCLGLSQGKIHWRKGEAEDVLFEEDKQAFLSLPAHSFSYVRYMHATADKKGKLKVDGKHWYSSAPEYAGHEMVVGLYATKVVIADFLGNTVAEHIRSYGDAPTDTTDPASQLSVLCNKLGGWSESKVRAALPDDMGAYMDKLERKDLSRSLCVLRDQCAESGWETTIEAAQSSLQTCGYFDRAAITLAARRKQTGSVTYDTDDVDLSAYDKPLKERHGCTQE